MKFSSSPSAQEKDLSLSEKFLELLHKVLHFRDILKRKKIFDGLKNNNNCAANYWMETVDPEALKNDPDAFEKLEIIIKRNNYAAKVFIYRLRVFDEVLSEDQIDELLNIAFSDTFVAQNCLQNAEYLMEAMGEELYRKYLWDLLHTLEETTPEDKNDVLDERNLFLLRKIDLSLLDEIKRVKDQIKKVKERLEEAPEAAKEGINRELEGWQSQYNEVDADRRQLANQIMDMIRTPKAAQYFLDHQSDFKTVMGDLFEKACQLAQSKSIDKI